MYEPLLLPTQSAYNIKTRDVGLERVCVEGDRPHRSSLCFEPRRDGVGNCYGFGRGAIDAALKGRDKLGTPLLSVPLALEEPLLPLSSPTITPIQDVARLLDDGAILQLTTTEAAREIDVESHSEAAS